MKKLIAVMMVCFLVSCSARTSSQETKSTHEVALYSGEDFVGSGTFLDDDRILTCGHVVDEGVECEVLAYDEDSDLAMIRVDEYTGEPRGWGNPAESGAGLQVHAYFEGEPITTVGVVANGKHGWTDAVILEGMSGGAVTDERGRLIGIVVGVYGFDEEWIGEFITLPTIKEFISEAESR